MTAGGFSVGGPVSVVLEDEGFTVLPSLDVVGDEGIGLESNVPNGVGIIVMDSVGLEVKVGIYVEVGRGVEEGL